MNNRRYLNWGAWTPGILVLFVLVVLAIFGQRAGWVFCWTNCGELFDSLLYVSNFRLYGMDYGLVQDMATSPYREGHPFLYTHNPNIGGYFFVLLEVLGFQTLAAKQMFTLLVFGVGLLYAYGAVTAFTRSKIAGLLTLVFFLADFEHVLSYALNPLRAWHWIALFGLLFHIEKIARGVDPRIRLNWFLLLVFSTVSLGVGYDYWIICLGITSIASAGLRFTSGKSFAKDAFGILIVFLLPMALRQIQMISVIGMELWSYDFLLSAAIKAPFFNNIIALPPIEVIEGLYRSWNILRPPAGLPTPAVVWIRDFWEMYREVLLPSYGVVAVFTFACLLPVCIFGLLFVGLKRCNIPNEILVRVFQPVRAAFERPIQRVAIWHEILRSALKDRLDANGTFVLLLALGAGVIFGLLFFAPLSFHIYIKHGFPLLAAPLYVSKAVLFAALFHFWQGNQKRYAKRTFIVAAVFLLIDAAIVNFENIRSLDPIDVSWVKTINNFENNSFAVSWIPNSVSVFTNKTTVGIKPGIEHVVAHRILGGQPPFGREDLFLFGERDADHRLQEYLTPDYWLYYPIDQNSPFDSASPKCRRDWISSLIHRVATPPGSSKLLGYGLSSTKVRPGEVVTFFGQLGLGMELSPAVFFQNKTDGLGNAGSAVAQGVPANAQRLQFNCINRMMAGEIPIPRDAAAGVHNYGVFIIDKSGAPQKIGTFQLTVDASAVPQRAMLIRRPQPTAMELRALLPEVPVVEMGENYVLFDLKSWREKVLKTKAGSPDLVLVR